MEFGQAIRVCFSKYVTFSGRAIRSEYWWFVLFLFGCSLVLSVVDTVLFGGGIDGGNGPLGGIFALGTFLPSLAALVRRLHDTGRSGYWFWIILIPLIGFLVMLYFLVQKGTEGDNDYGADPLSGGDWEESSVPRVPRD